MATTGPPRTPSVIEHDGMLWKPVDGATATAGEFIAARALFIDLNEAAVWNPWIRDERSGDLDRAVEIMAQWGRAEPGHRHLTLLQWEAQQARRERARESQRAGDEARCERDKARYDEQLALSRLRLLEVSSRLDNEAAELAGLRDGSRYPAMDAAHRAKRVAESEDAVARLETEVALLRPLVGDHEDVVDERGWLPKDRREHTWWVYRLHRENNVRDLKERIAAIELELNATPTSERAERRELGNTLCAARSELDKLIAEGPYAADEMCSECPTPVAHHGWVHPPGRPCPAWPGWAARLREARRILETHAQHQEEEPPRPTPQPVTVVPSGLPIAEVIERLADLQRQYPNAEVRRGRANRWELWAPDEGRDAKSPRPDRSSPLRSE